MPSPQDHRDLLEAEASRAKTAAYWRQHSLSTAVLLGICLAGSHFISPLSALLLLFFVLAGLLTERGATLYERGGVELGLAAQALGLLLGGYLLFAERQSFFATWVQGIGAFFIGFCLSAAIAQVLGKATSARK